tara:strand:- start:354 stop:551 length:198 start_codon:yes stop_codon:yes gene_type:complete
MDHQAITVRSTGGEHWQQDGAETMPDIVIRPARWLSQRPILVLPMGIFLTVIYFLPYFDDHSKPV